MKLFPSSLGCAYARGNRGLGRSLYFGITWNSHFATYAFLATKFLFIKIENKISFNSLLPKESLGGPACLDKWLRLSLIFYDIKIILI